MASTARKFRHGDRVVLDLDAPVMLRGVEWVLLDKAPLTAPSGFRFGVQQTRRQAPWAKGPAWWLQNAETGAISPNFVARESAMTLVEES